MKLNVLLSCLLISLFSLASCTEISQSELEAAKAGLDCRNGVSLALYNYAQTVKRFDILEKIMEEYRHTSLDDNNPIIQTTFGYALLSGNPDLIGVCLKFYDCIRLDGSSMELLMEHNHFEAVKVIMNCSQLEKIANVGILLDIIIIKASRKSQLELLQLALADTRLPKKSTALEIAIDEALRKRNFKVASILLEDPRTEQLAKRFFVEGIREADLEVTKFFLLNPQLTTDLKPFINNSPDWTRALKSPIEEFENFQNESFIDALMATNSGEDFNKSDLIKFSADQIDILLTRATTAVQRNALFAAQERLLAISESLMQNSRIGGLLDIGRLHGMNTAELMQMTERYKKLFFVSKSGVPLDFLPQEILFAIISI